LRRVARRHALSGGIASLLIVLAVFFIMADIDVRIGWVGLDSLIIMAAYIVGLRIIQTDSSIKPLDGTEQTYEGLPSLRVGLFGFSLATAALILVMPWLVEISNEIATITGLGTGFIGTTLVAVITSLPELVTTFTAVRMGVFDLAIGNLFGSNMFNMFALGLSDFFAVDGRFLGLITPNFVLVGLIGIIMTLIALIGNHARLEKKFLFLEIDAAILVAVFFIGMGLVYSWGLAP